ncbi:hypothetical protein [Candidatus Tisiphia endosymbiont of Micropterix aruncella]|uniref:hypothetical protein n=1 Tax=Candidatus Tisiphia endosymbiont of Micropterix aruncella TaxID=3066271 RepID=UPI003AA8354D
MQLLNKTFIRLDKILIPIKYFILISLHISIFSAFTALGEPDPPDKRVGKPLVDTYKKTKEKILLIEPSPYTTKAFLVQPSATRSEASLSPVNSKSIDLQSNKLNKQKQIIKLEKDILKKPEDIRKQASLRRMQHSLERHKKSPYLLSTTPEVKQQNILGDKNNKRVKRLNTRELPLYPNIPKIQGIQITEPSISQQSTANITPIATTSLVKTIVNTKTGTTTSPSSSIEDLMEQVNGFKTAEKQLETKRILKEEKLIKEEEFFKEIDNTSIRDKDIENM